MDRRAFIGGFAGGLLAWPLAATAQQPGKVPVVGVLNISPGPRSFTVDTARQGLRDLGYIDGQTIVWEVRFAGGKPEAYPAFAADLVRRKVDVLLVAARRPSGRRQMQPVPSQLWHSTWRATLLALGSRAASRGPVGT